ncbi:MAG: hypothetical protein FWB73_00090 [Treponema sp.]|nr:hypothetical protein [Treponema sp.]
MKENIGKRARDKITGFEGIITCYANHITGCDSYSIQPRILEGKNEIPESRAFDVGRIEILEDAVKPEQVAASDGKKGMCDIGRMVN